VALRYDGTYLCQDALKTAESNYWVPAERTDYVMAFCRCSVSADKNAGCGKECLVLVTGYNFTGRVVDDFAKSYFVPARE
jgi:hypothetical protein